MKKNLILLIAFIFTTSFCYSNDFKNYLQKANEYKMDARYSKAIRYYGKAIKNDKENRLDVKKVYFEIADCFLKQGKYRMAIRVMRSSIYNFGATKEDILNAVVLDDKFKETVILEIEHKYNKYRRHYIARLDNIDEYLDKKKIVLK